MQKSSKLRSGGGREMKHNLGKPNSRQKCSATRHAQSKQHSSALREENIPTTNLHTEPQPSSKPSENKLPRLKAKPPFQAQTRQTTEEDEAGNPSNKRSVPNERRSPLSVWPSPGLNGKYPILLVSGVHVPA